MASLAPLAPLLKRTAFFAETHAIKSLFAAERLVARFGNRIEALDGLLSRWQVLDSPTVNGPLSEAVRFPMEAVPDTRLRYVLRGAVFQFAYVAAVEIVRRHGVEALVLPDRTLALRRIGEMGHSYTIHRSFVDAIPRIQTDAERTLFAERYAEFVATQLMVNDFIDAGEDIALDADPRSEDSVIDRVLASPGFWGHNLTTLGTAYRNRASFSDAEWRFVLARLEQMAGNDVALEGTSSTTSVEDAAVMLLERGPKEAHGITLADTALTLCDAVGSRIHERVAFVLTHFSQMKNQPIR